MDPFLESLAWGPKSLVKCWYVYFVNGYKYHTRAYGNNKPTMNSGVCVPTCSYDNSETDFFGYVDEILEMKFAGANELSIVVIAMHLGRSREGGEKRCHTQLTRCESCASISEKRAIHFCSTSCPSLLR
ncbi:unnamed protein product, partial [Cuscuta epithymum]